MEPSSPFDGLGLPVSVGVACVTTLSFSEVNGVILVTVGASRERGAVQRVFVRRAEHPAYTEVIAPPEYAVIQALTGPRSSSGFLVAMSHDRRESALFSLALADLSVRLVPRLHHRSGLYVRSWVSELLFAEDAAFAVGVVAGVPPPKADGSYAVEYAVGRIDTTSGGIEVLAELRTPYA